MIPLIDGGTEGFKGQARVILPRNSACYECSLDMQTKPKTYPMCTIANTPRLPEHCIQWASTIEWPNKFPNKELDGDNPDHINWCLETAQNRAKDFNIVGINFSLTQGVIKNIIPAIASTNAIIAAACANEAYKIATNCASILNNYMMYMGDQGVYSFTFPLEKKPSCPVCGTENFKISFSKEKTLQDLIDLLMESSEFQVKKPSLRTASRSLYMQAPPQLEILTRQNLTKKLRDLVTNNDLICVTDMNIPICMNINIFFD